MFTRRLLALTAVLALVIACACALQGWSLWRMQREATTVAASLSSLPDSADPTQTRLSTSAAPAAPAATTQRQLEVAWGDGNGRHFRSLITLDTVGGARFETASDGSPMVAYSGSAQRRGDGSLLIDATDAAVSGPAAAEWIADSFVIRADGSVSVQDGKNEPCDGYLAQDHQPQTP